MNWYDLIPRHQRLALAEMEASEREDYFARAKAAFASIPDLYSQDGKGGEAIVHIRYFAPGSFWLFTELDKSEGRAFGWGNLNHDQGAELGYTSIAELVNVSRVEFDFYFKPKPMKELEKWHTR